MKTLHKKVPQNAFFLNPLAEPTEHHLFSPFEVIQRDFEFRQDLGGPLNTPSLTL